MTAGGELKWCSKCRKPQPTYGYCKECKREYMRARRKNPAMRERQRDYDRARRADPAVQEREREYAQAYRKDPAWREYMRQYRADPAARERKGQYQRQYRADPAVQEREREYDRRRRADPVAGERKRSQNREALRRRRAAKRQTQVEKFRDTEIFERDAWRCHICRRKVRKEKSWPHPLAPSLDHIVPLSKGGTHTRDNVACAHLQCNLRKNASLGQGVQPLLVG